MIRTLVSIEADLASSLAIRFACQLGSLIELEINPVYVKESVSHESGFGAGWASRTWEREIVEQGKKEISKLIDSERNFCPMLHEPKVVYGDREAELTNLMFDNGFELFVEGVRFSWNAGELSKAIRSRFYQKLHRPFVLVRSLKEINELAVLCLNTKGTQEVGAALAKIWKDSHTPIKLVYFPESVSGVMQQELRNTVTETAGSLKNVGCSVTVQEAPSSPESMMEMLNSYGLVALALGKNASRDSAEIRYLALAKTSSLIATYED